MLNTIDSLKLRTRPLVCLLPLGTGNDLGRTLGYGSGGEVDDVKAFLRTMTSEVASEVGLDRWRVEVAPTGGGADRRKKNFKRGGGKKGAKTVFMQNYMSVGVDALVTYNFHRAREDKMLPFSGRLINKLLFFVYGTKDVLERECRDLDKILELSLDGERVELPNIESIVVLNIPCWGAGVRPWELGRLILMETSIGVNVGNFLSSTFFLNIQRTCPVQRARH